MRDGTHLHPQGNGLSRQHLFPPGVWRCKVTQVASQCYVLYFDQEAAFRPPNPHSLPLSPKPIALCPENLEEEQTV